MKKYSYKSNLELAKNFLIKIEKLENKIRANANTARSLSSCEYTRFRDIVNYDSHFEKDLYLICSELEEKQKQVKTIKENCLSDLEELMRKEL